MAQTVQIPVSFDFRTVKVEWCEVVGRIIGWEGEDFALEFKIKGRNRRTTYSSNDLPSELWVACHEVPMMETYGYADLQSENDKSVERICADFRPHLFIPWGQPYLLSFSDMLEFEDELDEDEVDDDDNDEIDDVELARGSLPANAWQLRDAFLRVTPEPRQILKFLNRWGRWNANRYVLASDFVALQTNVREALVSAPEPWWGFGEELLLWLRRKAEFPYFSFETFDCERAIRMTVTVDLLRQAKFGICAHF
jgi:hypothetical protein